MQAGGRRFDPDWLHQVGAREIQAHEKIVKRGGVEAVLVFFENVNE